MWTAQGIGFSDNYPILKFGTKPERGRCIIIFRRPTAQWSIICVLNRNFEKKKQFFYILKIYGCLTKRQAGPSAFTSSITLFATSANFTPSADDIHESCFHYQKFTNSFIEEFYFVTVHSLRLTEFCNGSRLYSHGRHPSFVRWHF